MAGAAVIFEETMKPDFQIIQGDCRSEIAKLPEKSVHCTICSPPYWGLRKYEGVKPTWWGPSADMCSFHADEWGTSTCPRCDSWFGLLGLEPTIEMYVEHIVECFRAVRRVLRDDGCIFVNCGDSFDAKQLVGQPWRVAFALQADGWYLRSDIIWHKNNPMPESVSDRPTRAHEYLFLLTKKPKYYYDAEAVREKNATPPHAPGWISNVSERNDRQIDNEANQRLWGTQGGRNKRSVWTIPTEANPEAHFASFPRKLVLPCVLAGTSERGCCPECGTPWVRIVERDRQPTRPGINTKCDAKPWDKNALDTIPGRRDGNVIGNRDPQRHTTEFKTLGWRAGCECRWYRPKPDCPEPVLDMVRSSATIRQWPTGYANTADKASSGIGQAIGRVDSADTNVTRNGERPTG